MDILSDRVSVRGFGEVTLTCIVRRSLTCATIKLVGFIFCRILSFYSATLSYIEEEYLTLLAVREVGSFFHRISHSKSNLQWRTILCSVQQNYKLDEDPSQPSPILYIAALICVEENPSLSTYPLLRRILHLLCWHRLWKPQDKVHYRKL